MLSSAAGRTDHFDYRSCHCLPYLLHKGVPVSVCHLPLFALKQVLEPGLARSHHDGLARFLAAAAPGAAADAAALSGLSLRAGLALALRAGQLPRALACLAALATGASDRPSLAAAPAWRAAGGGWRPGGAL